MTTPGTRLSQRVLIIDDTVAIHEDFRKILGGSIMKQSHMEAANILLFGESDEEPCPTTFEIDSAFQGREGLEMVRKALREGRPYSLAFVDVRMPPGWDGIETIAHLWNDCPELQVVICTAYSDYSWEDLRKQLGRLEGLLILKKPFDTIEVIQMAQALTEKWHLFQTLHHRMDDLEQMVAQRTQGLESANQKLRDEIQVREQAEIEARKAQEIAEIARREVRENLDMIINLTAQVPGAVYQYRLHTDGHSSMPFSSSGMSDIFELSPEEVRGDATSVFRRVHPDDHDRIVTSIQESARTMQPFHCEFRVVLPRQGGRWRLCDALPERLEDGSTLWHGFVTDVTERKRTEEALRESEARLKEAQSIAHLGSWECDPLTNMLLWSDETYCIFEIDRKSAVASYCGHSRYSMDKLC